MAFKKYTYYNKGNKIGLAESEARSSGGNTAIAHCTIGTHSNKADCEAAGGQWIPSSSGISIGNYEKYVSPKETILQGLELEYSYAPTFNIQNLGKEGDDLHKFVGWGSNGTNLLLFTYGMDAAIDLSSKYTTNDWIYVSGSGRWSGLHQVKSTGSSTGILTLKTRCNLNPSKLASIVVDFADTEIILDGVQATRKILQVFEEAQIRGDSYIFVASADEAANNGLFSTDDKGTTGHIGVANKITINDLSGAYESAAAALTTDADDTVDIYNAFYEQITVYEGIEVLEDESFELDLTDYQAQAVVYYVKAKMSEDMKDIEGREYFMRLFKKQIEKGSDSMKKGVYRVLGFGMTN